MYQVAVNWKTSILRPSPGFKVAAFNSQEIYVEVYQGLVQVKDWEYFHRKYFHTHNIYHLNQAEAWLALFSLKLLSDKPPKQTSLGAWSTRN